MMATCCYNRLVNLNRVGWPKFIMALIFLKISTQLFFVAFLVPNLWTVLNYCLLLETVDIN